MKNVQRHRQVEPERFDEFSLFVMAGRNRRQAFSGVWQDYNFRLSLAQFPAGGAMAFLDCEVYGGIVSLRLPQVCFLQI
jgi:hypothetical protein